MRTNHQRGFTEKVTKYVGKSCNGSGGKGHVHFAEVSRLADKGISASANIHDVSRGKRGVARNIKGAKKFVRTRIRFHENAEVRKLMADIGGCCE